jgi:protein-tyrosine-phosphatase
MIDALFVCTGNTCRSPMAEALARREAARRGLSVRFGSAGTFAGGGEPATTPAIRAIEVRGGDLTGHRSRALTRDLLERAGLAIAMTPAHRDAIRHLSPGTPSVLATDLLPPDDARRGQSIPDPFGGDADAYDAVAEVLEACVLAIVDRLGDGA